MYEYGMWVMAGVNIFVFSCFCIQFYPGPGKGGTGVRSALSARLS